MRIKLDIAAIMLMVVTDTHTSSSWFLCSFNSLVEFGLEIKIWVASWLASCWGGLDVLDVAGRSTMGDLPRGLGPLPGGCRFTHPLQATPHLGLKVLQTSSMALPLGTHNSAPSILAAGRSHRPTLGMNMMHSGQVLAGCLHRTTLPVLSLPHTL